MVALALIGAGGKMGLRIAKQLRNSANEVRHVEIGATGIAALQEAGLAVQPQAKALAGAAAVILAVPDNRLSAIAASLAPDLAPGTMLITLDAAVPFIGGLPDRSDLTYFVAHPCHTPMFNDETDPAAKRDFPAGTLAKQHIVCALMQGPESAYALGEAIARDIYAPVMRAHRITVEQMAILEPALSETVGGSCLAILREALDEAVRRGVPPEAARDFLLGHLYSMASLVFEERKGSFSDAANRAIEAGKDVLFRPDWKRVFEPEAVRRSILDITHG
jgi:hypothetical protein